MPRDRRQGEPGDAQGKTLQPFEIQALKDFAEVYGIFLHIHHDGEEHYFFPFINEARPSVALSCPAPATGRGCGVAVCTCCKVYYSSLS